MIMVDTSAWYALLDEDDANHSSAVESWHSILDDSALVTHAYVVVETSALVQRRLGAAAAAQLHQRLLPAAELVVMDETTHHRSVDRWLAAGSRDLSLVDVTSFVMMERRGIDSAFAYDADFPAAGFTLVG